MLSNFNFVSGPKGVKGGVGPVGEPFANPFIARALKLRGTTEKHSALSKIIYVSFLSLIVSAISLIGTALYLFWKTL